MKSNLQFKKESRIKIQDSKRAIVSSCFLFLLSCLLAPSLQAQFSGAFAPYNWSYMSVTTGGDGSVDTSGAPNSIVLNGSDNGVFTPDGHEDYEIVMLQSGLVSFDYSHSNVDIDDAFYTINGVETFITHAGAGTISNVSVLAGDVFGFRVHNYDNCCGRGVLTVSAFSFTGTVSIAADPSNSTVCDGSATAFVVAATGAGTLSYQWQVNTGSGFNDLSDTGVYSGSTTDNLSLSSTTMQMDSYSYQCVVTSSIGGSVNSNNALLSINTLPTVTLSSQPTVGSCAAPFQLNGGSPLGGSYSGTSVSSDIFDPSIGAGSYSITYTYTDTNSCSSSDSRNITVQAGAPVATLNAFSNVGICTSPFTLSGGLPSGGTYSGVGVINDVFYPAIGNGIYSITYTFTDTMGCIASDSKDMTVDDAPAVSLSSLSNVGSCTHAFTLSGGLPTGGNYSGTGVTNNMFDPSVGTGTYKINYTVTDGHGCSNIASQNITVDPAPAVTFTLASNISSCAQPLVLKGGSPSGGTYTGTGVTNSQFDPSVGPGTYTLRYTYTDTYGCIGVNSQNITVDPAPVATLSSFNNVYQCTLPFTLTGGSPSGGTFSGANVSNDVFDPTAGTGTFTMTYTYTDNDGCTATASQDIIVDGSPVVSLPTWNNVGTCTQPFALAGGLPSGGTYSGTGVSNGMFDASVGAGTYSITYSWSDGANCSGATSQNITVDAAPTVSLATFSNVGACTSPFALSGGTPSGGTYSGTGVSNNTFSPSVGTGTYSITYSYTDGNGCSGSASQNITVNAAPVVTLTSFNNVGTCTPSFALTGGLPSGGTYSGTGVTSGIFDPSVGAGTYSITYSYTDGNGCSGSASQNITVNAALAVTLSSFSNVRSCNPTFALTGGWPAGGTYSGTGVSNNTFDPSVGAGTYSITYSYTDGNGCSGSASQNITVSAAPTVTLASFNNVGICNQSFALTGGSPVGGTYTGTGVSNNTFNPSVGAGTYTITYSWNDGNGCSGSAPQNITVTPLPTVTLSPLSSVCVGSSQFALSGGSPTGGVYTGTGVTNGIFHPSVGVGTYLVTYFYTNSYGCSKSTAKTITVNALPNVTLNSLQDVCEGSSSITLKGGIPSGGTYSGNGVSGGTFNPTTAGTGTTTITYNYTDAKGCSNSTSSNITVNAAPNVTLDQFNSVCSNSPSFPLSGGKPFGGTYSGNGVIPGNSFDPATAGVGTTLITYSYNDPNGCMATASQPITVTICNGVEEISSSVVKLYPNPTHALVTIELSNLMPAQSITVCDITGKELLKNTLANESKQPVSSGKKAANAATAIQLDLSKFAKGIYFVRVNFSNSTLVKKLVVE